MPPKKEVIDTNIKATAFISHFAINHITRSRGSIVLVSSLAGLHGLGGFSLYSASKMAYTALGQSLEKELSHQGVHVGVVYLSFVANESAKRTYNADGELEPVLEAAKSGLPRKCCAAHPELYIKREKCSSSYDSG